MARRGQRGELRMIGRRMPYYAKRGIGGIDANTVLMLHGEDFTDASLTPKTINNSGVVIASGGKFGNCLSFGGSQRLSINNNSAFNFGTGNFTIDFWMYCNVAWTSQPASCGVGGQKTNDSYNGWQIYKDGLADHVNYITFRGGGADDFRTTSTPQTKVWEHWAVVRNGGNIRWYRNGVKNAETTYNGNITDSSAPFYLGFSQTWGGYLNAKIDEYRVSNIARWTANFTPPTEPYSE